MKYIILLGFLFFIPASQAEMHFEPYGNVGFGYSPALSSQPLFMTYALGGRVGYRFLSVNTGIDLFWTYYDTGSSSRSPLLEVFHPSNSSKGFSQAGESVSFQYSEVQEAFQPFSIGVFTAVDLPFLLNAYGTLFYTFGRKKDVNHQGYGIKAGLSYFTSFHLQLNLEFQWAQYICMEKVSCSNNFDILSAMLSLSLPFSAEIFDFGNASEDSEETEEETEGSEGSEEV